MTKKRVLTNRHYNKKMANLGEKGKFRQKWRVCQKVIKGLAKYSNEITKRGILTNGDFTKMTRFDQRGTSIIVDFKKMTYFGKPANLARIETMRQQNRHIDSWRSSQKWQIWENFKWGDTEGNIGKRQISTNMASVPKIHQGFGQNIQIRWQKGACWHLAVFRTMTNFAKIVNLARSYQRFDKNLQRDDKKGRRDKWRL